MEKHESIKVHTSNRFIFVYLYACDFGGSMQFNFKNG